MDKLDNDMKELLKKIGVVDRSQVDNDTMDFICDFVDRHGGANAVKEDFAWHVPAEPSLHNDMQNTAKHHPVAHPHTRGKPSILNRPLPALPTETKGNIHCCVLSAFLAKSSSYIVIVSKIDITLIKHRITRYVTFTQNQTHGTSFIFSLYKINMNTKVNNDLI
jgi:hypothetical protein